MGTCRHLSGLRRARFYRLSVKFEPQECTKHNHQYNRPDYAPQSDNGGYIVHVAVRSSCLNIRLFS